MFEKLEWKPVLKLQIEQGDLQIRKKIYASVYIGQKVTVYLRCLLSSLKSLKIRPNRIFFGPFLTNFNPPQFFWFVWPIFYWKQAIRKFCSFVEKLAQQKKHRKFQCYQIIIILMKHAFYI